MLSRFTVNPASMSECDGLMEAPDPDEITGDSDSLNAGTLMGNGEDEADGTSRYRRMPSTTDTLEADPRWRITFADMMSWIKQLCIRECNRYVWDNNHSEDVCQCGRSQGEHTADDTDGDKLGTWQKQKSFIKKETDTFGRILFEAVEVPSLFVRLDTKTSSEKLANLLSKDILEVSSNDLVLHFVDFDEAEPHVDADVVAKLQDKLKAGLKVLADKTRLLLTSQGLQTGISSHLHHALSQLQSHSNFRIGVVTMACPSWGSVDDKDIFKDYVMDRDIKPGARSQPDVLGKKLSPYYSHYLFADDGTYHINMKHLHHFRERLEKAFEGTLGEGPPTVLVLMNGGPQALTHVLKALQRQIPVVIVKGSGGCADKIASVYLRKKPRCHKTLDRTGNISFKYHLNVEMDVNNDNDGDDEMKIREILNHFELLTVFDPQPETLGLDMVVVWALLKARQENKLHNLLESFLAHSGNIWAGNTFNMKNPLERTQINPHTYFLLETMFNSSAAVVEAILKGLDNLDQHFTMDNIIQLYNRFEHLGPCRKYLKEAKERKSFFTDRHTLNTVSDVRTALQDILGPSYPLTCTGRHCQCQAVLTPSDMNRVFTEPQDFRSCLPPLQEMFLWALLTNKQKLAMMLWKWSEDKIATALVGEAILRALAEKEDNWDTETVLRHNSGEFDGLAVEMLRKCYEVDEEESYNLLLRRTKWWGCKSCLQLAVQLQSRSFIAQQACKSLLDKIWFGGINASKSSFKKLTLLIGLIPGASLILFQISRKDRKGFSLDPDEKKKRKFPCEKVELFYTAPVVKYTLNLVMFIIFLLLFSYVLLVDLQEKFTPLQGVLCAWVATFLGEEVRQVFDVPERSLKRKLAEYFRQGWNKLDLLTIVLLMVGMVLVLQPGETCYLIRRVILNIDIFLFAMRLLQMFVVRKKTGPMLTMIQRMVDDTASFMTILLVFVFSYGVVSHSVLFPQASPEWRLLYDVPRRAYWQIYGEFFLDDLQDTDVVNKTTTEQPEVSQYIVEGFLAVYAIITHVLLLNILIAKFNYTFSEVQGEASKIWAWHRCQIIHEFYTRPWLPPPFNVIHFLVWIVTSFVRALRTLCKRCCRRSCCHGNQRRHHDDSAIPLHSEDDCKGVSFGRVQACSIEVRWDMDLLYSYNRYKLTYRRKESAFSDKNPQLTLTLFPTRSCIVSNLLPWTVYEFECFGGCETDTETSPMITWDHLGIITQKTESDSEVFQKMEKDIATNILAMTSPQDVVLQRTEELCKELTKMGKSSSTSQQTSVKALQHLSEEVAQLKVLHENYMTEKQTAIQGEQESVLQERVKTLEMGIEEVKHNQQTILKLLQDVQTKILDITIPSTTSDELM
ncbi:transient receptor potential cation channel subfamily M member 4-like isoform X2 [Haliotis asinina]|uniref:transient receptor potential cation channel subfamily M member 4-like isoform X2 n=1 Tax=Haliotis asinina TaxID=109174 RepID=UPI003531E4BD